MQIYAFYSKRRTRATFFFVLPKQIVKSSTIAVHKQERKQRIPSGKRVFSEEEKVVFREAKDSFLRGKRTFPSARNQQKRVICNKSQQTESSISSSLARHLFHTSTALAPHLCPVCSTQVWNTLRTSVEQAAFKRSTNTLKTNDYVLAKEGKSRDLAYSCHKEVSIKTKTNIYILQEEYKKRAWIIGMHTEERKEYRANPHNPRSGKDV
ncbi:MAG: hypothetical protein J6C87_07420 [Bacteroides sp.]|nr:hypothetical protein [Bacteroides sp.]